MGALSTSIMPVRLPSMTHVKAESELCLTNNGLNAYMVDGCMPPMGFNARSTLRPQALGMEPLLLKLLRY